MSGGELGELEDDDAAVLLGKEFGIAPHQIADWPHAWRLRTETVLSARRRAQRKLDEQAAKGK